MSNESWMGVIVGLFTSMAAFTAWTFKVYQAITDIKVQIGKLATWQKQSHEEHVRLQGAQEDFKNNLGDVTKQIAVLETKIHQDS